MKDKLDSYDPREIERKLSDILIATSSNTDKIQKDFSFYWSKKSSSIAASVYRIFAQDNDVIFDPFVGSGSALYGLKLFPNNMKFVGVDVNQLPIELIHFNMDEYDETRINTISKKINDFVSKHSDIYEYHLIKGEHPFTFKKAHINRVDGKFEPTEIFFTRKDEKLMLDSNAGDIFEAAKREYLDRIAMARSLNSKLPDLNLVTNSRIAIKAGMRLSDIFSPITFNLLLKYRELALHDTDMSIVLSTCLHLCRLTDKGSQSQFPFWVPKSDAVDRNIFEQLLGKLDQFTKLKTLNIKKSSLNVVPKRAHSFSELEASSESGYLLHRTPIQKISNEQLPDESVDLVFTDPPYFDQVAYSEYLVIWEFFTGIESDLENEIIESNRTKFASDRANYIKMMTEGFLAIGKKLKEGHLAVVYFKDSKLQNISSFLQIMQNSNLQYVHQIHVPKPKFTYKQNTSQKGTVEGDSLYVFRKVSNSTVLKSELVNGSDINSKIQTLIDDYLHKFGSATPSRILDDYVIPKLWELRVLHLISTESTYQRIVNENYLIDKETREVIGRK